MLRPWGHVGLGMRVDECRLERLGKHVEECVLMLLHHFPNFHDVIFMERRRKTIIV